MFYIHQNHLLRCNLIFKMLPEIIVQHNGAVQKLLETKKMCKGSGETWKLISNNNSTVVELFQSMLKIIAIESKDDADKEIPLLQSIEFILGEMARVSIAETRDLISRSLEESVLLRTP